MNQKWSKMACKWYIFHGLLRKVKKFCPFFGTKRIILDHILKATGKMLFKLLTVVAYVFWSEISEFAVKFFQKMSF